MIHALDNHDSNIARATFRLEFINSIGHERSSRTAAESFRLVPYSRPSALQRPLCNEKQPRFRVLVQVCQ
jgi:hypothetical protein